MNIKEYLKQAIYSDKMINSMLELAETLDTLVTKATLVFSYISNNTSIISKHEELICKILDLDKDIYNDINKLMESKFNI
ncbi:MAG: hypothetical protein E6235_07560 [Anaerococcus vaginalis]|uniref:hypothetical protein n=1 Tax=Anaerococcus vaginalis TaxID=33037 RepID=UPI002913F49E|nr:hypothetical protein [Anaerococcus vaginalis]MDU5086891.1 hypothetical protein [Anaerococcus vaginalis]